MKNTKEKDVLRKYIEAHLPHIRKTSLNKEVEILEDFIYYRNTNPKCTIYSRLFLTKVKNPNYHLERLKFAEAIVSNNSENLAVILDLAASEGEFIKRGYDQIRKIRELRVNNLIEHAKKNAKVMSIICNELHTNTIEEIFLRLGYSSDRTREKENHKWYNELVRVVKKSGIQPDGYDELLWKNPAKPWKLTDRFIFFLINSGVQVEA